jgi:hypothetical protein
MKTVSESTGKNIVVRSAKVPAEKAAKPWRAFNDFVRDAEGLRQYVEDLRALRWGRSSDDYRTSDDVEDEAERCRALVVRCEAGFKEFDRHENYDDEDVLKRSHVAKRIGILIGSFPNANPHAPDGYARMLIEHVAAIENLTSIALESACREIVETRKFAPAISEVVATIGKHIEDWSERRSALDMIENLRQRFIKELRELEEKQERQKRESEIREMTAEVTGAFMTTQRLSKEIEETKAKLATLIARHAAAEKRESELMRKLREVTASPESKREEVAAHLPRPNEGETAVPVTLPRGP